MKSIRVLIVLALVFVAAPLAGVGGGVADASLIYNVLLTRVMQPAG